MTIHARGSKERPPYAISSVDHALHLGAILQLEGSITVSQAADRLGVAPSTAHRLLSMLVYRDYAVRDGRNYGVGPVLAVAAHSHSGTALLRSVSEPHLRDLRARLDETVNVLIRTGATARFIASVEGSQSLRVGSREGMVFPAHRLTGGLILLAALSDEEIAALHDPDAWDLAEEPPRLDALMHRINVIRGQGFALNNGLSERGVLAVGYPIREPDGETVAAVSVSMPSPRFDPAELRPMLLALKRTARAIEADLAAGDRTAIRAGPTFH